MKLKSFRIRDYKSIVDTGECDLSLEGITILAGQNESGKTTILEALRDFDLFQKIGHEAQPDDDDEAISSIECTFSFDGEDLDSLVDDEHNELDLPQPVKEALLKLGKVTLRKTAANSYSIISDGILKILEEMPTPASVTVIPAKPEEESTTFL